MKSHQIKFTAMGGPCEIYLYGENQEQCQSVSTLAHHEVLRLEKKYSRYRDDSITSLINQNAGLKKTTVDAETAVLLDFAATCHEQSEGLFDITSGVLRQAWNFKKAIIPIQKEIDRLLPLIGWSKIHWQKPDIFLPHPEMQIDFGGYVKEYAADSVASICLDNEIKHGLVNLAGDVKIIGPHPNGKGWQIGIRHPRKPAQAIASIECQAGALASSGDYERYIIVHGKRYGHVLNPMTGWPADSMASVSVVADQCIIAGISTTVAMLKGDQAIEWLNDLGVRYFCIDQKGLIFRNKMG